MKNSVLVSWLAIFIFANLFFYYDIEHIFWSISGVVNTVVTSVDIVAILNAVLLTVFLVFFIINFLSHRKKKEMVVTVEFEKPQGLTPADVGYIYDGSVESKDMSALIVYWANKGFVEIKEESVLTKLKDCDNTFKDYEKDLFNKIFRGVDSIKISSITQKLADGTAVNAKNKIQRQNSQYFQKSSIYLRELFTVLIAFLFYLSVFYFHLEFFEYYEGEIAIIEYVTIGVVALYLLLSTFLNFKLENNKKSIFTLLLIATLLSLAFVGLLYCTICGYFQIYQLLILSCMLVVMFFVSLLFGRFETYTEKGLEILGKIIGLKNFISVAEKDRLEMLVKDDPTVFYDILPYAYVLGVSDTWIKKYNVIKAVEPENVNTDIMVTRMIVLSTFLDTSNTSLTGVFGHSMFSSGPHGSFDGFRPGGGSSGGGGRMSGGGGFGGHRR